MKDTTDSDDLWGLIVKRRIARENGALKTHAILQAQIMTLKDKLLDDGYENFIMQKKQPRFRLVRGGNNR